MPPPGSPTGLGVWVRNARLTDPDAFHQQVNKDRQQRNQYENGGADGKGCGADVGELAPEAQIRGAGWWD